LKKRITKLIFTRKDHIKEKKEF